MPRNFRAWALDSLGPDRNSGFFTAQFMRGAYDPTNGTIGQGGILRPGGDHPAAASLVIR